jgi:predicted nucleic acid-binding protein
MTLEHIWNKWLERKKPCRRLKKPHVLGMNFIRELEILGRALKSSGKIETMATEVVIDSSIIVALIMPEECSDWALEKTSTYNYHHIPEFAYYEVANVIKCKTPSKFTVSEAEKLFNMAFQIMDQFGVHSFGDVVIDALSVALKHNVAVYDAAFLCLADKLNLSLLTLDLKLAKKLENTKYHKYIVIPNV